MIALRFLALVSFSALLAGCGTFCPPPGHPGPDNETACWYNMKVTNIDKDRGEVTATISTRVKGFDGPIDYKKPYTFHVRHLDKLAATDQVKVGKEYLFFNANSSPSLEVFPNASDPESE
jgi:hypothetical protein